MSLLFFLLCSIPLYNVPPHLHSLVKGHLGCFQVLAMTNNATMNIAELCPCGTIEHPLGIYPKMVLLGLEVGCFLIF